MESVNASTFKRHEDEEMLQLCNTLYLSPTAVTKLLRCMQKQRDVEIWIAGGGKLAELLSELIRRIVANGTVPPQWKGGRLARLHKGKGDAADCNPHRGLLIADHASEVFTSLLQPPIAQVCDQLLLAEQCGCVRGRGTARVMLTSRQFVRMAAALKRLGALIFADLV